MVSSIASVESRGRAAAARPRPRSISIALVAAWAAWLSMGCQGGYPIPATRCDEWCDQTRRIDCEPYDPAECVLDCESSGVGSAACADLLNQTLSCLRSKSDAELSCENLLQRGPKPCGLDDIAACATRTRSGGPPLPDSLDASSLDASSLDAD